VSPKPRAPASIHLSLLRLGCRVGRSKNARSGGPDRSMPEAPRSRNNGCLASLRWHWHAEIPARAPPPRGVMRTAPPRTARVHVRLEEAPQRYRLEPADAGPHRRAAAVGAPVRSRPRLGPMPPTVEREQSAPCFRARRPELAGAPADGSRKWLSLWLCQDADPRVRECAGAGSPCRS
jgi:hypothetical protein